MAGKVFFCVQAVPGRKELERTKQLIEASDIGSDYTVFFHGPDETAREFFLRVLREMEKSGCELCVRFEDDLTGVNRNIRHNIESWPAILDQRFVVGWLLTPGGYRREETRDRWHNKLQHMAQGNVFRRCDLPQIISHVEEFWGVNPSGFTPDLAISYASGKMGGFNCLHNPSLVRHDPRGNSILGNWHHPRNDDDCGSFSEDWKRRV